MTQENLEGKIKEAARVVGKTWPLYSFVTANPLSGYEDLPFFEAVQEAGDALDANLLPTAAMLRQAWTEKRIGAAQIRSLLLKAGMVKAPEHYLASLEASTESEHLNEHHTLDRLTVKWLSLFLDEGMAAWPMPFKEMGFYTAWRKLIVFDKDIRKKIKEKIPVSPVDALTLVLQDFDENQQVTIFERHLAALPGWTGFIKYRVDHHSIWNNEYPVDLLAYLAARLWMARCLNIPILPPAAASKEVSDLALRFLWLQAWEQTWQDDFVDKIKRSAPDTNADQATRTQTPAPVEVQAQLVFCLDTRSELLRRGLEKQGPYETFGSAGAFGLPMDYSHPETGLINKSSPAMVPSRYLVREQSAPAASLKESEAYLDSTKQKRAYKYFLKRLKNILPSAFGFVEGAGLYYGAFMLMRLFRPNTAQKMTLKHPRHYETIFEPKLCHLDTDTSEKEVSLEEKAALVKGVFDACGWRHFAPLVVFTGHGSRSANNPFASSLDCGACAGNPGKRNARMLASLASDAGVRQILQQKYQIIIPDQTVFIAAEHMTSCDEVRLFDHHVPESHQPIIKRLQKDLLEVRTAMTKERLGEAVNAPSLATIKSNSWSESRPEWGLSGHAGYIIGDRKVSMGGQFGDCFMSSYDWQIDPEGAILKGILQGPLVVVQWISNHYYFSTVDNNVLGGGSKITHNITGKYGVMQGNGSDLKIGLPLQSLMSSDDKLYHYPIRITTLIQAPERILNKILLSDAKLNSLVNNGWIHVMVMDPEKGNEISRYDGHLAEAFESERVNY